MSTDGELYANDAVWAAFYRDGYSLRDICKQFGCGVYDISPWLTAPLTHAVKEDRRSPPAPLPNPRITELLEACRCALGHLTGNMDGDMDLGEPIEMLRSAISKVDDSNTP